MVDWSKDLRPGGGEGPADPVSEKLTALSAKPFYSCVSVCACVGPVCVCVPATEGRERERDFHSHTRTHARQSRRLYISLPTLLT